MISLERMLLGFVLEGLQKSSLKLIPNEPKITETIHEQHCQDKETIESLSLGGLAIFRTILSPSSSEVKLVGCGSAVLLLAP